MQQRESNSSARYDGLTPQWRTIPEDILSELGRTTTAYHEATPDRFEDARQEYEEALRKFNTRCEATTL
jgi:hypothetical protein